MGAELGPTVSPPGLLQPKRKAAPNALFRAACADFDQAVIVVLRLKYPILATRLDAHARSVAAQHLQLRLPPAVAISLLGVRAPCSSG